MLLALRLEGGGVMRAGSLHQSTVDRFDLNLPNLILSDAEKGNRRDVDEELHGRRLVVVLIASTWLRTMGFRRCAVAPMRCELP